MIARLPRRAYSSIPFGPSILRPIRQSLTQGRHTRALQNHGICRKQQAACYSTPSTTQTSAIPRPIDIRSQLESSVRQPAFQPTPKRSLRPYIYASLFLLLGLTAGQYVRLVIAPPPLPTPGSKEDQMMTESLHKSASDLPIVKSLSTDPSWKIFDWDSKVPDSKRTHNLRTGPLAGARALGGYQQFFINSESSEVITVIWFGGAVAGWPGVVHGGAAATVMDETLGLCAIRQFPSKTGVTANLELTYLRPVLTNGFYILKATPEKEGWTDRKGKVVGRIETLEGKICVEAKGLFVVPKKFKTGPLGDL